MAYNMIRSFMNSNETDIVERSQNVSIDEKGVRDFAVEVINDIKWYCADKEEKTDYDRYNFHNLPECSDFRSADWLFVLHTLNFSLWTPKPAKQWTVNGLTGYSALCYAIKKAIEEEEKPIWNPRYYKNINVHEMENLFRGDDGTCIPCIEERLEILHDVGRILVHIYAGSFRTCIKYCQNNAALLMLLLTRTFECYQDKVIYNGMEVYLNTKAKVLINHLELYYPISGTPCKMTYNTIFTDYRNLQILFFYNILRCNETLEKRLRTNDDPVCHGSTEELELRSCAIVAVRKIHNEVLRIFPTHIRSRNFIKFRQSQKCTRIIPLSIMSLIENTLFARRELLEKLRPSKYDIEKSGRIFHNPVPDINIKTLQY